MRSFVKLILSKLIVFVSLALCFLATGVCCQSKDSSESKIVVSNSKHVVSYLVDGNNIIFVMEAVGDFADDMTGKFPNVDFTMIDIDRNENGTIDRNSDIAFSKQSGGLHICTQYLIDAIASSQCGEFKSNGYLELSFRGTASERRPHPVYKFTVPISEALNSRKSAAFVFIFYSAGEGYTFYPNRNSNDVFSKTIKIMI